MTNCFDRSDTLPAQPVDVSTQKFEHRPRVPASTFGATYRSWKYSSTEPYFRENDPVFTKTRSRGGHADGKQVNSKRSFLLSHES